MLPCDGGALTPEAVSVLRHALSAGGYHWLPEHTGGKHTPKPWSDWRKTARVFDPAVSYVSHAGPLLNTALVCDEMVVFDLDIDEPSDVAAAVEVMTDCLGAPRCVRSRASGPRLAALYQTAAEDGRYAACTGEYGTVEVFSGPLLKLTAFGLHSDKATGVRSRLTWQAVPGNIAKADLGRISLAQAEEFLDAVADVLGSAITRRSRVPGQAGQTNPAQQAGDLDEIASAMAWVPNTAATWDEWNRHGMIAYGASGGDPRGLAAFIAWSRKNPQTRQRNCLARWQDYANSPPSRLGAGSLFYLANANGYRRPAGTLSLLDGPTARQRRASQRLTNFKPGEWK